MRTALGICEGHYEVYEDDEFTGDLIEATRATPADIFRIWRETWDTMTIDSARLLFDVAGDKGAEVLDFRQMREVLK